MAAIERIELSFVDLKPKVRRTDAIQSFVSQQTPLVRIFDRDGAVGTGYSYTIGTGGSSIMALIADHLAPLLIGRDAERVESIWRDLLFHTHATSVGAITALALAALGLLVTLVSDLRDERGEFFDLEAQGVTPPVLRRQFQLRSLALVVLGIGGGILLGLLLSRLVVALIQVSAATGTPEPPLRLAPAWGLSAAVGALVLALLAGLVELTTRHAFRDEVPQRATWSLE